MKVTPMQIYTATARLHQSSNNELERFILWYLLGPTENVHAFFKEVREKGTEGAFDLSPEYARHLYDSLHWEVDYLAEQYIAKFGALPERFGSRDTPATRLYFALDAATANIFFRLTKELGVIDLD